MSVKVSEDPQALAGPIVFLSRCERDDVLVRIESQSSHRGQPPALPDCGVLFVLTWGLRSVCSVCTVCSVCSCWAGWVVKAARQVSCGLNQRYSVGSVQLWHSPPAAAARWLLPMCVSWLCLPIENCFNWLISSWVRSDPTDWEWWSQSGRARSCGCPA